jgi:diaminohydroxyphosphoribosylaminopyrimidine deaminase / 5-amino-6-(5-phosphoribosylamino)uracil reductase
MQHALRLAERALGQAAPNPSVGSVIVSDEGHLIGRGWTQLSGRPHAETVALAQAGEAARGATAYVTLEPCAHQGETPPCAEALVRAGVRRVVAAIEDPDPRVSGRGFAMLREAGIEVTVTLKIAQSLDGKTAAASGDSKWITGEEARHFGHLLRARHDAILIGIETALADDPELTCRLPGLEAHSPTRVVLDTRLRLSEWSKLAQSAREIPTLVFTAARESDVLAACGVEVVTVARDARGRPEIGAVLQALAARGVTRLLVEGGAAVHAAFLDRHYADRLEVFRAPLVLGDGGHSSVAALAALSLDEAHRFERVGCQVLGPDLLESFAARA